MKKINNEVVIIQNSNSKLLNRNNFLKNNTRVNLIKQEKNIPQPIKNENKPKKMKWGEPTWFFFHTIAYKIKDEHFTTIKTELLQNIYSICKNLPCPICSEHATEYMNKINFNNIRTKNDLKMLFFNFHNEVNKKKNYPIFELEKVDEKYSKAVTINIIQNFMLHFQDKHKSPRMISNDFHRGRLVISLKEWLNNNIQYLDV
jgi:hypothetical protein